MYTKQHLFPRNAVNLYLNHNYKKANKSNTFTPFPENPRKSESTTCFESSISPQNSCTVISCVMQISKYSLQFHQLPFSGSFVLHSSVAKANGSNWNVRVNLSSVKFRNYQFRGIIRNFGCGIRFQSETGFRVSPFLRGSQKFLTYKLFWGLE